LDSSRLRTGEIVAGIGGAAMFLFLFFDWFSGGAATVSTQTLANGAQIPTGISHPGVSGWDALTDLPGFLIISSAGAGLALAWLAASGQRVNIPVPRGGVTAGLGALAVGLILWRMVAGSPTLKIGIFLGLGAAIAITVGAVMALREEGIEPLLAVAGGRTRAAAASAPAVAPAPPDKTPARSSSRSSGGTTTKRRATTRKAPARRASSGGAKRGGARKTTSRSRSSSSKSKSSSRSRSSGTRRRSTKK
jgi:hypothetical protein